MAQYGEYDYPMLAKTGFFLGVVLFVVGSASELLGHALFGTLPQ